MDKLYVRRHIFEKIDLARKVFLFIVRTKMKLLLKLLCRMSIPHLIKILVLVLWIGRQMDNFFLHALSPCISL
jgi:hypothetical protein